MSFSVKVWAPKVFISNGGYDRQKGMELADRTGGLVSYGKHFLANVRLLSLSHLLRRSDVRIAVRFIRVKR